MLTSKFMTAKNSPKKIGKGAATKTTILEAARQRFGKDGYALATIRTIAADANIDPALVIRYFGDKEALFLATAQFDLRLPDLAGLTSSKASRVLVGHFLARWEEDDTLMALLRVACTNKEGVNQLHAILQSQIMPVILQLSPDEGSAVAVRAGLVASQMLGMGLCRYILQLPPLVTLDHAALVDWVAPTIERYVFDKIAESDQ
jgi:AcrR family transcriptional regulator